jgi:hypothetical protein
MRLFAPLLFLFVTACIGPIETRVDSRGTGGAPPVSFAADPDVLGPVVDAQKLVAQALVAKGYRAAEFADVSLHVTLSDRPADLSLHSGPAVLAPSSGKKLCAKREYRLGVTLTKIADGALFYQSHAAEFHCKLAVEQVLPALVDAALKDVGEPRGSYTVKRPR